MTDVTVQPTRTLQTTTAPWSPTARTPVGSRQGSLEPRRPERNTRRDLVLAQ